MFIKKTKTIDNVFEVYYNVYIQNKKGETQ
nr:MAG TPA: hypothetical protein [Caudoviricetes sp.]